MVGEKKKGVDWDRWITHIIAFVLIGVCSFLIIFAVVFMDEREGVTIVMGFSSSTLGIILGYYFNRERLVEESLAHKDSSIRYNAFRTLYFDLQAKATTYERVIEKLRKEIEEEPVGE
ncbi:MAG TPA: hypothetical protein C5S37_06565 [Methanophagales archaeon]|nr:hypothetical protein [Methanophagales archaeon]